MNLANIIKDLSLGSGDGHLVSATIAKLKEMCSSNYDDALVLKELETLQVIFLFFYSMVPYPRGADGTLLLSLCWPSVCASVSEIFTDCISI